MSVRLSVEVTLVTGLRARVRRMKTASRTSMLTSQSTPMLKISIVTPMLSFAWLVLDPWFHSEGEASILTSQVPG